MLGMITCKEASELISQGIDKKLGFKEAFLLKFHTLMCPNCRKFAANLKKFRLQWPKINLEDQLPGLSDKEKEKIQTALNKVDFS
jgi:uncharacterized protein (DUF2225 family)